MKKQDIARMLSLVDERYISELTDEAEAAQEVSVTVQAVPTGKHYRGFAALAAAVVLCAGLGLTAGVLLHRPEEIRVEDRAQDYGAASPAAQGADPAGSAVTDGVGALHTEAAIRTAGFELLAYDDSTQTAYVLREGWGVVQLACPPGHPLTADSPSGLLLDISWEGTILEGSPYEITDAVSIEITGEGVDFVGEYLPALIEKYGGLQPADSPRDLTADLPGLTETQRQGLEFLLQKNRTEE